MARLVLVYSEVRNLVTRSVFSALAHRQIETTT